MGDTKNLFTLYYLFLILLYKKNNYLDMLEKEHNCICEQCGTSFYKNKKELTRSNKNNRKHFCCRQCVGLHNVKNFLNAKSCYLIKLHSNNKKSEDTKFGYHLRNIKKRGKEIDVTINDLKTQWYMSIYRN